MKFTKWLIGVAIIGMILMGCKKDKSPTKADESKYDGKLNASISGNLTLDFKCSEAYGLQTKATAEGAGSMHIQGIVKQGSDEYMIDIQVYHEPATGTYELAFPPVEGVGSIAKNNTVNYSESGSVTFTQVSATRMVGTFSFTAFRMVAPGQKVTTNVSSGTFDVPVIIVE